MPAYASSGTEPFKAAARNRDARWRGERLQGDIFYPALLPGFHFRLRDPIFTIGSCFAQEVQMVLAGLGASNIITLPTNLPESLFQEHISDTEQKYWPLHFFHRFNVPSIVQEIERLINPAHPLNGDALIIRDTTGMYRDYHYSDQFPLSSLQACIDRRALVRQEMQRLRTAELFIITLGLLEAWRDNARGLYFNVTPPYGVAASESNRYEFVVMAQVEVKEALTRLFARLSEFAPSARIVITVSPIPLDVTFAPNDVVVSTTHSKATLMSAAREMVYEHPHADYFPSYEMAMLSSRSLVWASDGRHVRSDFVAHIVGHFLDAYAR